MYATFTVKVTIVVATADIYPTGAIHKHSVPKCIYTRNYRIVLFYAYKIKRIFRTFRERSIFKIPLFLTFSVMESEIARKILSRP